MTQIHADVSTVSEHWRQCHSAACVAIVVTCRLMVLCEFVFIIVIVVDVVVVTVGYWHQRAMFLRSVIS